MRILIVIDKPGTAIWRLAEAVKDHTPHHDIRVLPVHPKRAGLGDISKVAELAKWADLIDVHYWRSGEVVWDVAADELKEKPKILFHFNPYDAENREINGKYDAVVVGNETIHEKVPFAHLIPYGVDLDFFKYREEYTGEKTVNMSVARIEGKKGVREVAQACRELGYKFKLVGRISEAGYMKQVMEAGKGSIEFFEDVTDEKLREVYYGSAIHVCNSVSGYESGTLPVLENMACGIPVLTRNVGHIPDLDNGSNMVVRKGGQEDLEDLKKNLKDLMENRPWRLKLREKAWDTARGRDIRQMVLLVNRQYNRLYRPSYGLMSVIIPTRDNPRSFVECFVGALQQDYPKFEVVVADSGDAPVRAIVEEARKKTEVPIKYVHFPHKGNYTLAEARNRAVIEAEGEYLVFCDDRLRMETNAVSAFSACRELKTWLWGGKDGTIKGFVENFSCVNRRDLIDGGLFSERVQWYGGMTQEVRQRFEKGRGFRFVLIEEAKANQVRKAKSRSKRREDIVEAKWLLRKMYA